MRFAINIQMVQLAMALACMLLLEPVSGRAIAGGQARRDLSAGNVHGHDHIDKITSTGGSARRHFDAHHDWQENHDHIPRTIYKRVPPKKTVPQKTTPKSKKVPVKAQPKKQPLKQVTPKKVPTGPKNTPKKVPDPKTGPKKNNCATKSPSKTGPGKNTPSKKKTGIRSVWGTLTRRAKTRGGTDTNAGASGDACPVEGKFLAQCGVELNAAELGISNIPEPYLDDIDSLTADFENQSLEKLFFDTEVVFKTSHLRGKCFAKPKSKQQRAIKFDCNDGSGIGAYSYSWGVWAHPTPSDFFDTTKRKLCNPHHQGWFVDIAGDKGCENPDIMGNKGKIKWGLEKKEIIGEQPGKDYHTEHIYELNFLGKFFNYLNTNKKAKVSCENLHKYVFEKYRPIATNNKGPTGGTENKLVQQLISELGSEMNMERLAVLGANVNILKYNILAQRIQNPVDIKKFRISGLNQKMTAFRRVCMVMEYLTMTREAFQHTKDAIEKRLQTFDTAMEKITPFPLPSGLKLKTAHHEFINEIIKEGNAKASRTVKAMLPEILADKDFQNLDTKVQKIFKDFNKKTNQDTDVPEYLTPFEPLT